jgi:hypothetical protein
MLIEVRTISIDQCKLSVKGYDYLLTGGSGRSAQRCFLRSARGGIKQFQLQHISPAMRDKACCGHNVYLPVAEIDK